MHEDKTEGIILHTTPFQDFHEIVKVLTNDHGVMSFMRKYGLKQPLSPLSRVEIVFQLGKGDLHRLVEIKSLETYLQIRTDYDCLLSALNALDLIKKSQLPENPSQELYELLSIYLRHWHEAPLAFELSFTLKLLRFAGHLSCTQEGQLITSAPPGLFTEEEEKTAFILAFGRSLKLLKELFLPPTLPDKIGSLVNCSCL